MKMNDNTILRIKVPAHLYEAVKAQLTLNEAKKANQYGPGMTPVAASERPKSPKGASKAPSNTPKAASERPKSPKRKSKADTPQKLTGAMFDKETTEKMGAGVSETKKMGLEELKALAELLNNEITKLEEKSHDKEEKAPMKEKEKMEESMEYIDGQPKDATSLQKQMDIIWEEINEIEAEIERLEPVLKTDETDEVRKKLENLNKRRTELYSQALDIRDEMEKSNRPTKKIHQMRWR